MTIYEALALAHGEMTDPPKTSQGYNYKFAPMEKVVEIARPILAKHGLFVMQFPINDGESVGVRTIVGHKSGEKIEDYISMPLSDVVQKGNAAQQIGAVITYLRRYSLMAVCGMAPEDDDAQSVPAKAEKKSYPSKAKWEPSADKDITEKQLKLLNTLLSVKGKNRSILYETFNVESLKDLNELQASAAIKKLKEFPDQPKKKADIDLDEVDAALSKNDAKEGAMYDESIQ